MVVLEQEERAPFQEVGGILEEGGEDEEALGEV